MPGEVSVRELRNHGGEVLNRVLRGEAVTVTRDGTPVAELVPLRAPGLHAPELLRRWRNLPPIEAAQFREDIDAVIDQSL